MMRIARVRERGTFLLLAFLIGSGRRSGRRRGQCSRLFARGRMRGRDRRLRSSFGSETRRSGVLGCDACGLFRACYLAGELGFNAGVQNGDFGERLGEAITGLMEGKMSASVEK